MDYIIFCSIFFCYMMYYRTFQEDRDHLKLTFLYQIYHICLFEINGIIVSDTYISHSLERIFNARMMAYSRETDENEESLHKDSEDHRKFEFKNNPVDGPSFLNFALIEKQRSLDNSGLSDANDQQVFKDRLKRSLTARVVKFEPLTKLGTLKEYAPSNARSHSPIKEPKEASILMELDADKSKVLKERDGGSVKKKRHVKRKNFLTPMEHDIDIEMIVDSEGLAGKKFHCGQVSPRVRQYLGVTRGSVVNDRKEILFHRMRAKGPPVTFEKKEMPSKIIFILFEIFA